MEEQTAQYADGIALQAEPLAEKNCSSPCWAKAAASAPRTHRLQQKLSESLRRAMHRDTGGVLAAMTTGDRSGFRRSCAAPTGALVLAHVLVVSGMHVSILCGDILERFAALPLGAELPQPQTAYGLGKACWRWC